MPRGGKVKDRDLQADCAGMCYTSLVAIENRKAFYSYDILQRVEAGIVLKGPEVKSLREGRASIGDAYARVDSDGICLVGFQIQPYPCAQEKIDPMRRKRLLLKKREIAWLRKKIEERGLTVVPLRVYFNRRGLAKVELGLARGKVARDRRLEIKKRELQRDIERGMKRRARV